MRPLMSLGMHSNIKHGRNYSLVLYHVILQTSNGIDHIEVMNKVHKSGWIIESIYAFEPKNSK